MGVDYFFPGYAVWAKLIEAAADMGYETNNLVRCFIMHPFKILHLVPNTCTSAGLGIKCS